MSAPPFVIGWFYVVTEEAAPIMKKLFEAGIQPGAVITVPDEDLEILRDGVSYFPIQVIGTAPRVIAPPIGGYTGPRSV